MSSLKIREDLSGTRPLAEALFRFQGPALPPDQVRRMFGMTIKKNRFLQEQTRLDLLIVFTNLGMLAEPRPDLLMEERAHVVLGRHALDDDDKLRLVG